MDDLIFKNIPAEGFDTESGFTERVSNPTPSRKNSPVSSMDTSFPVSEQRFSNPTPSRRVSINADEPSAEKTSVQSQNFSQDSRMSNPTPTRRRRTFDGIVTTPDSSVLFTSAADYDSRLSNPTPTRRRRQEQSADNSSFGVISGVEFSRVSNPTPRRRGNNFDSEILPTTEPEQKQQDFYQNQILPEISAVPELDESTLNQIEDTSPIPIFDQTAEDEEMLSFASVDNPYGVEENDVRTSAPPIVRKPFEAETSLNANNMDDNRLSNYTPTHRKQGK